MNNTPYQSFGVPEIAVTQQRTFVARVYGWMTFGLVVTALSALFTLTQEYLLQALVTNSWFFLGLVIAQFVLVIALTAAVSRLSPAVASALFIVYAALNGVIFSFLALAYTASSIAVTFFITAATFGLMSLYGYVTKRDLTTFGNLLVMALIGFLLASVVNVFLASSAIYWITSVVGILIFVGLVAYDTQKIKRMSAQTAEGTDADKKSALVGALALYLDFINLFLLLLRFTGRRR